MVVRLLNSICVTKEFCLFDVMMAHILKRIEAFPDATFRESELIGISKKSFDQLVKNGFLEFDHYDGDGDSYFSDRIGDGEIQRTIRIRNNIVTAFSTEEGVSTIELAKPEITYYRFNLDRLIQDIKRINSLSGKVRRIDERLCFVGEFDSGKRQIAVYLGLFSDFDQASALLGLKLKDKQYEQALILCPEYEISEAGLLGSLNGNNVFCFTFGQIFKKGTLQIDFSKVKTSDKVSGALDIPELTATEKRKYSKDYSRRDIIEFINKTTAARSGVVLINGRELELQYNLYGLLLALALSLKQEKDSGWVHFDDIEKEKLVRSRDHFHRSMSELSGKLDPFVEDNKIKLLQNLKRKSKYRLSTMPSRLKTPHSKWLASRYKAIKGEIIKERAKRVGEVNM